MKQTNKNKEPLLSMEKLGKSSIKEILSWIFKTSHISGNFFIHLPDLIWKYISKMNCFFPESISM